jgi:hypothetical protein
MIMPAHWITCGEKMHTSRLRAKFASMILRGVRERNQIIPQLHTPRQMATTHDTIQDQDLHMVTENDVVLTRKMV